MGCAGSKHEGNTALFLCRERVRFIKQAMDSRYALSAAQMSYTHSLRNVGVALRQFAECDTVVESSMSASEPDKSPSHSSCASPLPARISGQVSSPGNSSSPLSPRLSNISYMRATTSSPLNFTVDSSSSHYVEEESLTFPFPPPPPPPPPDSGFSWDFFDPVDADGNGKVSNGGSGINQNFSRLVGLNNAKEDALAPLIEDVEVTPSRSNEYRWAKANSINDNSFGRESEFVDGGGTKTENGNVNESVESLPMVVSAELSKATREKVETDKELCTPREDASKLSTNRAKDFVSSIKDIEHRFTKAAESGHEVSRMLETKKISLSISSEIEGKSSDSLFFSVFHPACCNGRNAAEHGNAPYVTKVITWKRSISSRSSSSRNPLTGASKDDGAESCSDFIEEFSMISGSHSSTLDRLYAWERKLCDEVKASESVRKAYDQKCDKLRHQFARDMSVHVIDKTRATVKDLHSRVRVAIQAVNSISRRIEKLRDEELLPQLLELIQGLIRMWKAMLECHHAQYITISLAYHMKSPTSLQQKESYMHAATQLQNEIHCFASSFANWVDAQKSYVEALNAWLQKCILPPQERSWRRRIPFSPRRALAPPIFVLSGDWVAGINSLPSNEVTNSLQSLTSNLHELSQPRREKKQEATTAEPSTPEPVGINGDQQQEGSGVEEKHENGSDFASVQASLTQLFDQLAKFSEDSANVYESVKQGTEQASEAYINAVRFRFQQGSETLPL